MLKTLTALIAVFFIVAAVACGGDDDSNGSSAGSGDSPAASDGDSSDDESSDGEDSDDTADDSDDDPQPVDSGGSSGAGVGFVQAGDQRFDVNDVRRCEPFFEGDDNLDLQAIAADGVILFVVVNAGGSAAQLVENSLSIQGGGLGVFNNSAFSTGGGAWLDDETAMELPGAPFNIAGDRVQGMLQLHDSRGSGETLDVSFDIPIPADIIDC